ncbi:MAG: YfhO family protein [Chloroflexi bacterium]|nr:YfhO family protein [Chloroflexota bacterium]
MNEKLATRSWDIAAWRSELRGGSLWPLLTLLLLPFGLFWAETLGLRVFYHHDLQYYFFPYHKLVVDITQSGHLPLWNPYAFSGIPLLGDGQTAMFYPPNWLFWLLSPIHALTVVVLLHFSIAGGGMWLYLRRLRLSRLAAFVAALAFMFNGFLVARVVHLSIMAGAALIPLIFWSIELLLQQRTRRAFVLAAAMVCVQALAGHPQVPIYTAVGLGLYILTLAILHWRRERHWRAFTPLVYLAGVYVVGYALAAIQLVPWIEFASFSPRAASASYGFVTFQSLVKFDWLLFLFPYGYGGLRTTWLQSAPAWDLPVYMWERLAYVGILPLALAIVGIADLKRRRAAQDQRGDASRLQAERLLALIVVLVVLVLIAAGSSTPFGRLVYLLPAIGKLRAYARAIAVACFAITALAAFGVERLKQHSATARRLDCAPVVAALLLMLVVDGMLIAANTVGAPGFASAASNDMFKVMLDRSLQLDQANAYVPLLLSIASVLVLWWLSRGVNRVNSAALVAIVAVDLLGFAASFNPTIAPDSFARVPGSVAFLRRDPKLFRTASFITNDRLTPAIAQEQLAISWALPYGVEDINGFNSLQPRRYTDVLFGPEIEDVSYGFLRDTALLQPDHHLLSMLNVKYVLVPRPSDLEIRPRHSDRISNGEEPSNTGWRTVFQDQHVYVLQNPAPLDRAYFVSSVNTIGDAATILAVIKQPGFNPGQQALVEGALPEQQAQRLSTDGPAQVQVERVSPNELRLHTQATTDRFLVLSEMWFPGWHAEIDGQALPIYRTNYLLRGLVVPAGEHTIRMYYRPTSALVGAGITALAMAGCGLALTGMRRRRAKTIEYA